MSQKDYYQILGVDKSASEVEIKRAYKKLALKWHPDKNRENKGEAEHRFKEIAEAYAVLSDPTKRSNYDNYGSPEAPTMNFQDFPSFGGGFRTGGGFRFEFTDAEDIFRQFFGGKDPFANFIIDSDDDNFFMQDFEVGGGLFGNRKKGKKGTNRREDFFVDPFEEGMHMSRNRRGFVDDIFQDFTDLMKQDSMKKEKKRNNNVSKNVRTITQTKNGKTVTKTITTITKSDGTVETITEEFIGKRKKPKKAIR